MWDNLLQWHFLFLLTFTLKDKILFALIFLWTYSYISFLVLFDMVWEVFFQIFSFINSRFSTLSFKVKRMKWNFCLFFFFGKGFEYIGIFFYSLGNQDQFSCIYYLWFWADFVTPIRVCKTLCLTNSNWGYKTFQTFKF